MTEKFGTIPDDFQQMEAGRKTEKILTLERFIDIFELLSYFGEGPTYQDKIKSGTNNPDFWITFSKLDLSTRSQMVSNLIKKIGDTCELGTMEDLSKMSTLALLETFGYPDPDFYPEFNIEPTSMGFSVNTFASDYRTKLLLKIHVSKNNKKVGDLSGEQKYVPLEPSYVSTPHMKVSMLNAEIHKSDDFLTIECIGSL